MKNLRVLKKLLPKRSVQSNKTDGGKALIIGGGKGLYGAGILAGLAATRSGVGYTHLMTDLALFPRIKYPDLILHKLLITQLKKLVKAEKGNTALALSIGIGPGLGVNEKNKRLLWYLIKEEFQSVVVDADALTLIAKYSFFPLPATWIMTPHEGELARLLKTTSKKIQENREWAIQKAQEKFKCTVLLKGHSSLIISPGRKMISIKAGTKALAKAGTGDVLLGMIVAFRAQGLNPFDACVLAVSIHGKASKNWELEGKDYLSLRPMDIIDSIPEIFFEIRNS